MGPFIELITFLMRNAKSPVPQCPTSVVIAITRANEWPCPESEVGRVATIGRQSSA